MCRTRLIHLKLLNPALEGDLGKNRGKFGLSQVCVCCVGLWDRVYRVDSGLCLGICLVWVCGIVCRVSRFTIQ